MSYLEFHAIFVVPPILLMLLFPVRGGSPLSAGWSVVGLALISAVAFLYTAPWDAYLISRGVWGYGTGRVVGTIGGVPLEEYLFFVLQPLLAGLWLYRSPAWNRRAKVREGGVGLMPRFAGGVGGIFAAVLGLLLLMKGGHELYLGLILAWSSPVLAAQWAYGGAEIWRRRRDWLAGSAVPTLYLWFADDVAIRLGIWHVSGGYTTGPRILGLPVEEALFFAMTNLMVVQGILLFAWVVRKMSGRPHPSREPVAGLTPPDVTLRSERETPCR